MFLNALAEFLGLIAQLIIGNGLVGGKMLVNIVDIVDNLFYILLRFTAAK